jgi:hypothetical protein
MLFALAQLVMYDPWPSGSSLGKGRRLSVGVKLEPLRPASNYRNIYDPQMRPTAL